ncbi:hypothetical protein [Aquimarina sp. MMG016]|uniref:hypothetical protein n=1 Tax=Aquimarina sp. MMG016 TaxID=2822690 RepID=UPI001B3A5AFB|nr:hypothetical protein [Aquimarina sp. MMG016]MBQ4822575.1 hypothetical protein [Aquimarina sp. MMG016]
MRNRVITKDSPNQQTNYLRLSRMGNELSSMLSELHSYRCEPCTPDMHEQYMELNHNGLKLKQTINQTTHLVKNVSERSNDVNSNKEINGIIEKYNRFQKHLSSYLSEAVVHH